MMRSRCRSIVVSLLVSASAVACRSGDKTAAGATPGPTAAASAPLAQAAPVLAPPASAPELGDARSVVPGPDFAVAADPLKGYAAADGVTTEAFLAHRSPACLACARQALCLDEARCEDAQGNAAEGPAAGRSRTALCRELLACAQATRCASGGLERAQPCFCGQHNATYCMADKADGPCKSLEAAALETSDPKMIAATYISPKTGGGRANDVLECIALNCAMCF